MTAVESDKHRVFLPASKHSRVGNEQCSGFQLGSQLNGREHSRLQEESGIVKFHPHLGSTRLLIDGRINVSDAAAKFPVRQVGKADFRFLSQLQQREVLLVDL